MEFDELKARSIIRDWQLSELTLVTWRRRNAIPDRYAGEPERRNLTEGERAQQDQVIRSIFSSKINKRVLGQRVGKYQTKLFDVRRGSSSLTTKELADVRALLVKLRLKARTALAALDQDKLTQTRFDKLNDFLNDPLLLPFVFLDRNRPIYQRWQWACKSHNPQHLEPDLDFIKQSLIVFISEMQIL